MPLHLDPVSRRRFLGGSAVLALSPLIPASRAAAATEHWALLSDTHIAADPSVKSRQGINMAEHLRKVVAEVLAEKESLTGVLIDGDCAYNDGQPGDYTTLLEILDPLREAGLPVLFTLGNHDDRGKFSAGASFCAEASTLSAAPSGADKARASNARISPFGKSGSALLR